MSLEKLRSIAREINLSALTWDSLKQNETFLDAVRNENPVYSHAADEDTVNLLRKLCGRPLPAVDKIPFGFDGHRYSVRVEKSGREYSCWCVLPKRWTALAGIINKCVEYAQLNQEAYGCSVQKTAARRISGGAT